MSPVVIYNFQPTHAAAGGILIGAATMMKMVMKGQILGISGIAKGLVQGKADEVARWRFLVGMVTSGLILREVYPAAFVASVVGHSALRHVVAGFAVGFGSGIGNGCTSGHGISGNARLSKRSITYTLVFMFSGFTTATLMQSTDQVVVGGVGFPSMAIDSVLGFTSKVLVTYGLGYASIATVFKKAPYLTDFLDGSLFGLGLGLSGMANPVAVVEFLDLSKGTWNPTLMCVMGGALAVMFPFMQGVVRPKLLKKPLLDSSFHLPTNSTITRRLLLGGLLFGFGWGLAGICPGPGLLNLANPFNTPLVWLVSMFAGFALAGKV
jgi:uncharacterized membrane protein YedE/YeeE